MVDSGRERCGLAVGNSEHVGESRINPIGESDDRRLLVRQYRSDAARGHDRRDADKSPSAQNDVWAERGQGTPRGEHTEGHARGIGKISQREVAAELPGWYGNEPDAHFFSRPLFHTLVTADPDKVR
jgi:hypothetical protein